MPRADYFKDKPIRIEWVAAGKQKGSQSDLEFQQYSKSATTQEMFQKGGARHFTNDMTKGLFKFTEQPYRRLQEKVMAEARENSHARRTRIRHGLAHLAPVVSNAPGGRIDPSTLSALPDLLVAARPPAKPPPPEPPPVHTVNMCHFTEARSDNSDDAFLSMLNKLTIPQSDDFDSILQTCNAEMLHLSDDAYSHIRESYPRNFGQRASHARGGHKAAMESEPTDAFECLHSDSYGAMADVNEDFQDQLLFWLTDEHINSMVIQLAADNTDKRALSKLDPRRLRHWLHLQAETTPKKEYTVQPQDIVIDELKIDGLKDYDGIHRQEMAKAVAKELTDLASLGTFQWCKLPDNRRPISSKLVLKIKYKADGKLDKYKGRLVARGFEARPGIDFFGTFAPMASMTTVRTLFSLAVRHKLPLIHCDIPNAFLQSKIDVEQYLMLPKGVTIQPSNLPKWLANVGSWDNRVVKLLRSIYGLKSAPQLFNKLLNKCLVDELSLKRTKSDTCLYTYKDLGGYVLIATEVDDCVITGTNTAKIQQIKKHFQDNFKLKDWDSPIRSFMGINIQYHENIENPRLEMDVEDKIVKLFERHSTLRRVRSKNFPLPPKEEAPTTEFNPENYNYLHKYIHDNYASIVGAIIYTSITCRPDITFAVGRVSRGMHAPTPQHVRMLEHLLGYLKKFPHLKLVYMHQGNAVESHLQHLSENDSALATLCNRSFRGNKTEGESATEGAGEDPLFGMSDSDYANTREDKRKSISGYCFFVYGNLVSWKSKLQPITAGSTHEAELIAMSFAADEAVWQRRLLLEIGFAVPAVYHIKQPDADDPASVLDPLAYDERKTQEWTATMRPTWLMGDNQSAIFTATNPETSQRSKHLEIRWFRIRDYCDQGLLSVRHIRTDSNIADFFTKPLQGHDAYNRHRKFLMGLQDFREKDIGRGFATTLASTNDHDQN